jgi:hypothetical protein
MIIIKPGSIVQYGEIKAWVLAIEIRGGGFARYEIAWILNGDRKTTWVESWELEGIVDNGSKITVGFSAKE